MLLAIELDNPPLVLGLFDTDHHLTDRVDPHIPLVGDLHLLTDPGLWPAWTVTASMILPFYLRCWPNRNNFV